MKTKHVESLEEMVFRNKNKLYGAYSLRKKYTKYLTLSLFFAFILMISGISYPVIASYLTRHRISVGSNHGDYEPVLPPPPSDVAPPPPPPPPPPDAIREAKFTLPKVVIDSVTTDYGKQSSLADNKPLPPSTTDETAEPADNKPVTTISIPEKPAPFLIVQEMPAFPGGEGALLSYLHDNMKYPQEAREINVSGKVYLTFVVEPDGSITGITVLRGIGSGCDEEAVRVIKAMPNWSPGKQNNVAVRVRFNLDVKFTLQ